MTTHTDDQPTPGEVLNGGAAEAYAHLKKRLNEPGAFRMDDEQRLHTLLSALAPSKQPEPVALTRCDQCNGEGFIYPNGIGDGHNHRDVCPSCGGAGGFDPVAPLYTQPSKQTGGGGGRKVIARIIDPTAFEPWEGWPLGQKAAFDKADAILAAISTNEVGK